MYPVPGRFFRYNEERAQDPALAHTALFRKHGVGSVHGSLAFVIGRPFVASPLVGASSLARVKHNLAAVDPKLAEELLVGMQAIYRRYGPLSP
nr:MULTISPECIES: aldo/keto reductase [Rhizobium]